MDKIILMIIEDYKAENDIHEFVRHINNRYTELKDAGLIHKTEIASTKEEI